MDWDGDLRSEAHVRPAQQIIEPLYHLVKPYFPQTISYFVPAPR